MEAEFRTVDLAQLVESKTNPRRFFDKITLEELRANIQAQGVLVPLLVRPLDVTRFEILAGARRSRAARDAGLTQVPVRVVHLDDAAALEVQVIDNLQRADLHPLEEALGFQQLVKAKYDVARIAERTGRSARYIYDRLKFVNLTDQARELFLENRFSAGHAVILARLSHGDQERVIGEDFEGPLWLGMDLIDFDPDDKAYKPGDDVKAIAAQELQAWVDKNVRFETAEPDPVLFPATAMRLQVAEEQAEKVVHITQEYHVQPEAKDDKVRTFGPMSWKRADGVDGSKSCDRAVTGVVVVGHGRGEAFKVCVDKKKCSVHWGTEKRAAAKASKSSAGRYDWKAEHERQEADRKKEQAEEDRWKKALPAVLQALAERVLKAPATPSGVLGQLLMGEVRNSFNELRGGKLIDEHIKAAKTAEDLVRYLAFGKLAGQAAQHWWGRKNFPVEAKKLFGLDLKAIVDREAPPPTVVEKAAATTKPTTKTANKKPAPKGPLARKKR